jgi:hypothetical protein
MHVKTMLVGVSMLLAGCGAIEERQAARPLKVVSDTAIPGFVFPESVGCDQANHLLYVSQFGGTELKPAEKDGKGFISKVGVDGKILEARAFPEILNKPKGIWVDGLRLWVADIDSVWIFDTRTRKGRRLMLPGIQFANDVALQGNVLYVSDNRSDQLFRVEPADFLDARVQPKVQSLWSKKDVNPNGLWPAKDGSLLMAGFLAADKPRAIFAMGKDGAVKALSKPIGRLDGLYEMHDGTILATDWDTGSFFRWRAEGGMETLAKDFKGPADFCVMGTTAFVPDLVKGEVRILEMSR